MDGWLLLMLCQSDRMCGRNNPSGSWGKRRTGVAQGHVGTERGSEAGISQSEPDIPASALTALLSQILCLS